MSDSSESTSLPPALIEIGAKVRVPASVVRTQYSRSSGPGGQNVNKVSSRCEFWVKVDDIAGLTEAARTRLRTMAGSKLTQADEIHIASDEARSQEGNRSLALDRLREMILRAMHEPRKRKKTKPSFGAKQRRLKSKKIRSDIKRGRSGGFD